MKALGDLTSVSIALMFIGTIFFVASEVAQLAIRAEIRSLFIVTLSLSMAFLISSCIVARLNSNQAKCKRVINEY
jgi:hypothetical protein